MKTKIKKQLHRESNHYDPHDNNPIFNAMPISLTELVAERYVRYAILMCVASLAFCLNS